MKYLALLLLLLPAFSSPAQTSSQTDTLQQQINQLRIGMSQAGNSLIEFQKDFKKGITFTGIGIGTTVLGLALASGAGNGEPATYIALFGAGLTGVGIVISIVAHRHIKDAGIILRGNGIAIPLSD